MTSDFYYPLKLSYFAKDTIWGGDKLSKKFGKGCSSSLGETWELTVRKDEQSFITNGPLAGMTLGEYIDKHTSLLSENFPLLIKFIDAADKLSVQVHPDDSYAVHIGTANGKTEMWYILEAEENASIIYGTSSDSDVDQIRSAMSSGNIEKHLNKVAVSAGDVYFIPGGLIHAIGKGIVLAEIQQNSDTTFRFYDYDRKDKNGNLRELHIDQAFNALKKYSAEDIEAIRFSKICNEQCGELLACCEYFSVSKLSISDPQSFVMNNESPFVSLLCTNGNGNIKWQGGNEAIAAGDSFYIPKELGSFEIHGNLEILVTTV